ncbi:MAG: redox-regulated ATPase YchF [Deltaproteobacteria bacterium]|nr:redox-regulated ATPase YchF [Deltaproteobacteria bacterium]
MGLEVGIVGLPNIGKSTLFNAITSAPAEVANYPFCTIEPNVGIVAVPDKRLQRIIELITPQKQIPNVLKMVDIAGIVKGASQGEGLGNQFLSHIRQVDVIAHVIRLFKDENVTHVDSHVNPISDIDVIHTELCIADYEQVEKKTAKIKKQLKSDKNAKKVIDFYERLREHLNDGNKVIHFQANDDEMKWIKELNLITAKPYFYILNISENELTQTTPEVMEIKSRAQKEGVNCIPICCKLEAELSEMSLGEQREFLDDLQIKTRGLDLVIQEGFQLLDQITFFTAGEKEVRAWNVKKNAKAPEAAGKIHSDIERGFIKAEVYHYNDLDQLKSEAEVRAKGKLRTEGKDYQVQDGDIMHFRFNV